MTMIALLALITFAGTVQMPPACTKPDGMAVDLKGRLAVAAPNIDRKAPGAIFRIDEPGTTPVKWFEVPAHPETGYSQPMGITFGPEGEMYVCDCNEKGKGRLLRITLKDDKFASCETVAEGLDNANGVKYLNGRLYMTQAFLYGVKRSDGAATSGLYMFDANARHVRVTNTPDDAACVFSDVTRNPSVTCGLNGVAIDEQGAIYTGNYGDGRLWKLTPGKDGRIVERVELVRPEAGMKTPDGLCVDTLGNVYVADMQGNAAWKVSPTGKVTAVRCGGFNRPSEPCMWRGSLYVADFGGTTLQAIACEAAGALSKTVREIKMLADENWWGVDNNFGREMPFTSASDFSCDLRLNNYAHQALSFLVSDRGRAVWCPEPVGVKIAKGVIRLESDGFPITLKEDAGTDLASAFRYASKTWFPPTGEEPELLYFSAPQYNTWIELTYHQNEKDILAYAQSMLDHGLPPGVFMIDDTWQLGYGTWEFDPRRFSDPKGMMDKLHAMGYKVLLWMCPFVSMDTPEFRRIQWGSNPDDVKGWPTKGGFLARSPKKGGRGVPPPACINWWNGTSALLDFTHPNAVAWFDEQLQRLVRDYGADGFKFDGGSVSFYSGSRSVEGSSGRATFAHDPTVSPAAQSALYGQFALKYKGSEYRNVFGFAGKPVIMRLHDKDHSWEAVRRLVPDMLAAGFVGCPFICPDMVGGGSWSAFLPGAPFSQELFIRSAQVQALCPMMQLSASPWRYLDKEHQAIFKRTVDLRQKFAPKFVRLAKRAAKDGEPIMRNLEYVFPGRGYGAIRDEFLMGDDLLVAPVVEQGAKTRTVTIPPGTWVADDGSEVTGPTVVTVETPLARLPHFVRKATRGPFSCVRACPDGAASAKRLWQGISPQVKAWELGGRAETLKWFEDHQFGKTPVGRLPDQVIGASSVSFTNAGLRINITCCLPDGADAAHPVPVFLFGDHCGGERAPDFAPETYGGIPTNSITARGYAYVRWNFNDVCPNSSRWSQTLDRWPVGIVSYLATGDRNATNVVRTASSWGTIGAWAWGNSRVMDWIESRPELDAGRVAVLGHSRGGKTALWTGAQDERFAMTISNGSGCGGARLGRAKDPKAEAFEQILRNFPNWFCPATTEWIGRDAEIPHDADDLIRLIAPRLVYVASGSEDAWAGPVAEKAAWDAAHDLYRAYGLEDRMGYHCHEGPHKLRADDWERFMDFADRHLKAPSSADSDAIERRIAAACADGSRAVTLTRNASAADGAWRLTRAILVPDDFTLVFDGCRVELVDGTKDNIVRNAGAKEGACVPNRGIRILGRNGAVLSGGRRNHYLPRRSGDPNGWRSVGILLCDVSDYEVGGFAMEETQCWAISQERCSRGRVHDIVFGSTDVMFNQDGVDVRKGCHDLVIENISGSTGDDAVALTAYRDPVGAPARYGMQIGGNADRGAADDVFNVTIRNVHARSAGGHGVIRLLACDGIKMHHVVVEDVVDTAAGTEKRPQATIRLGDVHYHKVRPCAMGEMHHITVRNVKASGPVAVWVKGPICDSSIVGISETSGGRKYDITAPIERVVLDEPIQ